MLRLKSFKKMYEFRNELDARQKNVTDNYS